jgi:hypothetical protein
MEESFTTIMAPDITNHGWAVANNMVSIVWMDLPPAPDGVLENVHCGCKSGCSNNRCSCFKENLHCTDMCRYEGCPNRSGSADENSENEAEDYDINHEDDRESDNDYGDN